MFCVLGEVCVVGWLVGFVFWLILGWVFCWCLGVVCVLVCFGFFWFCSVLGFYWLGFFVLGGLCGFVLFCWFCGFLFFCLFVVGFGVCWLCVFLFVLLGCFFCALVVCCCCCGFVGCWLLDFFFLLVLGVLGLVGLFFPFVGIGCWGMCVIVFGGCVWWVCL